MSEALVPARPEDGGFDVEWPGGLEDDPDFEYIRFAVEEALAKKGYCVLQTQLTDEDRDAAVRQAKEVDGWQLPKREFESAYMGRECKDKYAMLPNDDLAVEPSDVLAKCDRYLTHLGLLMEPIASAQLSFDVWGRMSGMLRIPLASSSEEQQLRPAALSKEDYEDGRVVGHLNFLERRKLLMLMFICNDAGGELLLHEKGAPDIHLPVSQNKILIFRHDLFGYSYKPKGFSLALQAWLLSEPVALDPEEAGVVDLPVQLHGDRAHVMAFTNKYPGDSDGPSALWNHFVAGGDALVRVPKGRWDVEEYYSPDRANLGTMYTIHGGFCPDSAVIMFDNRFFNVGDKEAETMSPGQRIVMETGFDVLHRAGHTRDTARGLNCGLFLGDSGNDWPYMNEAHNAFRPLSISNYVTGSRLSYALGLLGVCNTTDTACSSSLVAVCLAHVAVRRAQQGDGKASVTSNCSTALALGCSVILSPRMYLLYCGPGMLSPRGRCFTFDDSADGYARGEGCGGLFIHCSDKDEDAQGMLACLIGSAVNQDGRSASLTAPNGPAQQLCIRTSMFESGLVASEITVAECHGTGTALGDPIEVSALRAVMDDREKPICMTSAKSNISHLEAAAGMAGLIKCLLMLTSSCAAPNVHLAQLNHNLFMEGYPAILESELTDYQESTGMSGVSSFGFGGTNARGDVWSRCLRGARWTSDVNTAKWLEHRSAHYQRLFHFGEPGPQDTDVIHLTGTWDAYSSLTRMERATPGIYVGRVVLGDTCCEQFRLVLNKEASQSLHPDRSGAGPDAPVVGPDAQGSGNTWLVSGKAAGTVVEVRLEWRFSWEHGEQKSVTWTALDEIVPVTSRHVYSILGSWTSWKFQEMTRSAEDPPEANAWTTTLRIGLTGREEFQLARDNDWSQVIYPAIQRTRKTSVPVRGPDHCGNGKTWQLVGSIGESTRIQLRVEDGEITLVATSENSGVKTWKSTKEDDWMQYYLTGTWNNWGFSRMARDEERRGVHRYLVELGASGCEDFHIMIEKEWELQLYPDTDQAGLGEYVLYGPDANGFGRSWRITGTPGSEYQICLDLYGQDPHRAVYWTEL